MAQAERLSRENIADIIAGFIFAELFYRDEIIFHRRLLISAVSIVIL
jgi:hypothetical protein